MEEANKKFQERLEDLYNDQIPWTAHLHHGFYEDGAATIIDQEAAVILMVEKILEFANIPEEESKKPKNIVDVGCGFGGVTLQLGKKYGAKCVGINIVPYQIEMATKVTIKQGLEDQFKFQVGDANSLPFPDKQFDLVWSSECVEHMRDKAKFVSELVRITAPGGTILISGMIIRDLAPDEESLKVEEKELLGKLTESVPVGRWISWVDYVDLFQSHSMTNIKHADWTKHAILPSVENMELTDVDKYFTDGGKMGLLIYAIMTCKKPE